MFELLAKVIDVLLGRFELSVTAIIKTLLVCMITFGGIGSIDYIQQIIPGEWLKFLAIGLGLFFSLIVIFFSGFRLVSQKIKAGIKASFGTANKPSSIVTKTYARLYYRKKLILEITTNSKRNERDHEKAAKTETVTEFFLISQQNKLAKAKRYSMYGLLLTLASSVTLGTPFEFNLIFFGLLLLIQVKEEILIYRVNKGYFGSTTREAMMLIEFIGEQKDDSDMNSGGRRKHVFKPLIEVSEKAPNLGSLENFR